MINSMSPFRMTPIHQSFKILFALLSIAVIALTYDDASAAQSPDAVKKARQACSRLAEKLANARKLKNNTVQSSSNYNLDKDTCFAQIEVSQIIDSKSVSENKNENQSEGQNEIKSEEQNEKRHRQIILINASTNTILAIAMWEEPKGLRVGHVYDPSYDGPRDIYENVETYMRKKMALNMR